MQKPAMAVRGLSVAMLTTLMLASPLYAQQTAQPSAQQAQDTEQESSQQSEQETGDSNDSADVSEEQTQNDLPDIDNEPIQPGSGGPGRFIPSEQISQDLGVSFPVDI